MEKVRLIDLIFFSMIIVIMLVLVVIGIFSLVAILGYFLG